MAQRQITKELYESIVSGVNEDYEMIVFYDSLHMPSAPKAEDLRKHYELGVYKNILTNKFFVLYSNYINDTAVIEVVKTGSVNTTLSFIEK